MVNNYELFTLYAEMIEKLKSEQKKVKKINLKDPAKLT